MPAGKMVSFLKHAQNQLKEASTHKSAKTHNGTVSVTWPSTFWPEINEFPGLIVEHLYIKFGDPSCIGF